MTQLIECVPNFSEGREAAKVEAIVEAIGSVPGVYILDREMDADHNRSVITFAARPAAVGEAAFRGVAKAVELIDLTRHHGAHPRLGAADVVPFVPVEGVTLEDCVALARQVGERIWRELGVPVYLYEAAATRPEHRNLENIRKGQFEGLREEIATNPDRQPDFGEARVHPTAGATVVGARKFLIAYNINLSTPDVAVAKAIAKKIRTSSGGFPAVKAMGVELKARRLAQVSMNLTDFETTSMAVAFDAVAKEAAEFGASIVGSEIVGLVPKKALEDVSATYLKVESFHPRMILENRLAEAAKGTGLEEFIQEVAAPTPAPGGGSVAAAAGALAAALGRMVAGMSRTKKAYAQFESQLGAAVELLDKWTKELEGAVRLDAESYATVAAAYKLPKDAPDRDQALQKALKRATEVPLEVAERAAQIGAVLEGLASITSPAMASDLGVGRLMAEAALEGALENVEINLGSIKDEKFLARVRERVKKLERAEEEEEE